MKSRFFFSGRKPFGDEEDELTRDDGGMEADDDEEENYLLVEDDDTLKPRPSIGDGDSRHGVEKHLESLSLSPASAAAPANGSTRQGSLEPESHPDSWTNGRPRTLIDEKATIDVDAVSTTNTSDITNGNGKPH